MIVFCCFRKVTSVPKKSIASTVVCYYCACYTFFRNGRYIQSQLGIVQGGEALDTLIIGALNHLTIDARLTGLTYGGAPARHLYDKETFVFFFCTRSGYCFIAQGLKVHRKKKKIAQMLLVKDSCSLQMKRTKNY